MDRDKRAALPGTRVRTTATCPTSRPLEERAPKVGGARTLEAGR